MKPAMAVLVDGDQVGPDGMPPLMDRLAKRWSIQERVCVRNWRSTRDQAAWRDFAAAHSFHLVQRDPVAAGKNASDIELAVLAMDFFHRGIRAFCLVSGDTDFTPLVDRLRRADCTVEWVAPRELVTKAKTASRGARPESAKAPLKAARKAAAKSAPARAAAPAKTTPGRAAAPNRAAAPARAAAATKTAAKAPAASAGQDVAGFARQVRRAIAAMRDRGEHEKGWVSVNRLGSVLAEQSVHKEDFGFPKRRALWEALAAAGLQIEQMETGQYRVTMA